MIVSSPLVSIVVPMFNEANTIAACVAALRGQTYPAERVEIVLIDGRSTDNTMEVAGELALEDGGMQVLENPARIQSVGFNVGIRASLGEMVGVVSAHSIPQPDYIERCVALLRETGADNVGGGQEAYGTTALGRATAAVYGSRLGFGGASHHHSKQPGPVKTVFPGFYPRSVFDRVGLFDESLELHEDFELNARIRAAGGVVYYDPHLHTPYMVRSTIRQLARQQFRYGRAKFTVARKRLDVLAPYHLAPPALVAVLALSAAAAPVSSPARRAGAGVLAAYVGVLAAGALTAGDGLSLGDRLRVPVALATMHVAWGAGALAAAVRPLRRST